MNGHRGTSIAPNVGGVGVCQYQSGCCVVADEMRMDMLKKEIGHQLQRLHQRNKKIFPGQARERERDKQGRTDRKALKVELCSQYCSMKRNIERKRQVVNSW